MNRSSQPDHVGVLLCVEHMNRSVKRMHLGRDFFVTSKLLNCEVPCRSSIKGNRYFIQSQIYSLVGAASFHTWFIFYFGL